MNAKTFRWDDLKLFLAVYRGGSLSVAAQKLGLNQSTLSRRLGALEAELDVTLFDRRTHGTLPTEAAELIFQAAERAEAAAVDVSSILTEFEAEPEGTVRLASMTGVLTEMVIPAMPELLARYPKINIELIGHHALANLHRREADLAIRAVKPVQGDLVMQKLGEVETGVFGSPAYRDRLPKGASVHDLDWIGWEPELSHLPEARWMAQVLGKPPRIAANGYEMIQRSAQAGMGAVLISHLAADVLGLVELPVLGGEMARESQSIWLVGHRALRDVPRVKAVWDWIWEGSSMLR